MSGGVGGGALCVGTEAEASPVPSDTPFDFSCVRRDAKCAFSCARAFVPELCVLSGSWKEGVLCVYPFNIFTCLSEADEVGNELIFLVPY